MDNCINRIPPKRGQFWHHFEGADYYIIGVGHHSESQERMVVYCRVDMEDSTSDIDNPCIMPISLFMSEIDRDKHPDVRQKYTFIRKKEFRQPMVR